MSKAIYKYRVYCITEADYIETWAMTEPTVCPNVNTDTIDQTSWTIVDKVSEEVVQVKEEDTPTGGHFIAECLDFDVPASAGDHNFDLSWPINIAILSTSVAATDGNVGDKIEVMGSPDTVIGGITADVNVGDTTINVQPTIFAYAKVGYNVSLLNASNGQISQLGRILSMDPVAGTVIMETASDKAHSAAAPTYFRITVCRIHNFRFAISGLYTIGVAKIGASYLPANTPVRVIYNNVDGLAKKLAFYVEYLY